MIIAGLFESRRLCYTVIFKREKRKIQKMDKNFLISVIIPAYNGEKYVERAVTSVLKQKIDAVDIEKVQIIVVDDGSKDRTLSIAQSIAVSHPNITVVHQDNKGEGGARNTGIELAKGKYIAFLDCDDWWDEAFLDKELTETLEKENIDIYEFSFKHVTNNYDYEKIFAVKDETIFFKDKNISNYNYSSLWKHLFKTTLIKDNHLLFGKSKTAEDLDFAEKCYFLSQSVKNINRVMYVYYKNSDSVMHKANSNTYLKSFIHLDVREKWFGKYGVVLRDDCDYQRILLARRYIIHVCMENSYRKARKIVANTEECNVVERYEDFIFPKKQQAEIIMWMKCPLIFWIKSKIFYLNKEKIEEWQAKNRFISKLVDSIVYRLRHYDSVTAKK